MVIPLRSKGNVVHIEGGTSNTQAHGEEGSRGKYGKWWEERG